MMNNPEKLCRGNSYMRYANAAAELERASEYTHAAHLWLRASLCAASSVNTSWATCRADVCNYKVTKLQMPETLSAAEFNRRYPVGSHFRYKTTPSQLRGELCKTVSVAQGINGFVMVEINRNPYYVNIRSLDYAALFND